MQPTDNIELGLVVFGHAISLAAIVGAIGGIMPGLAATGAFIWYCICVYESKTVQDWRRRKRKHGP